MKKLLSLLILLIGTFSCFADSKSNSQKKDYSSLQRYVEREDVQQSIKNLDDYLATNGLSINVHAVRNCYYIEYNYFVSFNDEEKNQAKNQILQSKELLLIATKTDNQNLKQFLDFDDLIFVYKYLDADNKEIVTFEFTQDDLK